jgi:hypothetical protein
MNDNKAPQLRAFSSEEECLNYFVTKICRLKIRTHDGYEVKIRPNHFKHAFYEDDGKTKQGRFSFHRAKHMDWIQPTLEHPVRCHQGWDYKKARLAPSKRVSYCYQTFIVVIEFRRNRNTGEIAAEFITCFDANRSFDKISRQPVWDPSVLSDI